MKKKDTLCGQNAEFLYVKAPGIFLGVKGGRLVGLMISPPSVSHCLENVGASTSHNPMGLHGLLQG
jgi:hypothetical protein